MSGISAAIKTSEVIFNQTLEQIRDEIIRQGYSSTEAVVYVVGNKTQVIKTFTETATGATELISKSGGSIHSGKKIGESAFKRVSD